MAGPLARIAAAALLDLRRWRRQRIAVATALILPAVVATVVVSAIGEPQIVTEWVVVDNDEGPAAQAFFDEALADPAIAEQVTVHRLDGDAAQRALDGNAVSAVIVLPHDLSRSLEAQRAPDVEVVPPRTEVLGTDLARLVVDQFTVRSWAESTSRTGTGARSGSAWPLDVVVESATGRQLDAATHYGPAIGMFFVLVSLGFATHMHVTDREDGIDERLASADVPRWTVVAGRAGAGVAIGGLSLAVTAAVMGLAFGRTWGAATAVVALVLAVLVCYAGIAAVMTTVVKTAEQAQVTTVAVSFLLMLGSGSLAPPGTAERSALAPLLPTTHALDAFAELAVDGAGAAAIAPKLLVLVGIGTVLLGGSATLSRRST